MIFLFNSNVVVVSLSLSLFSTTNKINSPKMFNGCKSAFHLFRYFSNAFDCSEQCSLNIYFTKCTFINMHSSCHIPHNLLLELRPLSKYILLNNIVPFIITPWNHHTLTTDIHVQILLFNIFLHFFYSFFFLFVTSHTSDACCINFIQKKRDIKRRREKKTQNKEWNLRKHTVSRWGI